MKGLLRYLAPLALVLSACSPHSNSWTSKLYHNTTAHFNGYYYANQEIRAIEKAILANHVDDYNRILRLYPTFDSTLAESYQNEAEEAIKMASIAIERHPNSKWVDDAYMLVGKARLYTVDWGNAIQTFKYINTRSKDRNTKHLAIINLIRTYTEHGEFSNARAAIDYLEKAKLSRANHKAFLLEKAYFHQLTGDYDRMVRNLTAADNLLKKRDRKGRIYFIIGQVYQKLGFEAEAYNYYKKCLGTNPEYEVDFYARLYMAQVTEISRNRDVNAARKSFRKLLKDAKNRDFKDKIYYEMGVFELKQNNVGGAIDEFNRSVRAGNNQRIRGEAYLRLGEIYYDTLRNYELSQAYYDSAITSLPQDYENYDRIKERQEVLNEFVTHLKTVQWQDSLLRLSNMDSTAIRLIVDSVVTAERALAELRAGKKKKRRARVDIDSNAGDAFGSGELHNISGDWYFGNPTAVGAGQLEFRRIWGDIKLEDNWRRSQRMGGSLANSAPSDTSPPPSESSPAEVVEEADPVDVAFTQLVTQIPRTPEAKQQALTKIENAYYHLGNLYNLKLLEKQNAVDTYHKLLDRFPQSAFEPEVLYALYVIVREWDPQQAERYASQLKTDYPNSTYTRILINPDYLKESSQVAEQQKAMYKIAYHAYEAGAYDSARMIISEARALGETIFNVTLELLDVLIIGRTATIEQYQKALQQFIDKYPDTDQSQYAQKLLKVSEKYQEGDNTEVGYKTNPEGPHYFVVVYRKDKPLNDQAASVIDGFNRTFFTKAELKTSNLTLDDQLGLTFVSDLPGKTAAMEYYKVFTENLPQLPELRNHKFDNFVITKENFDIFYRTKGLNEYLRFFEKNYQTKSQ